MLEWGGVYANALYDDTHGATGAANGETPTKPARAAEALPGGGMRFEQLMLAAHVAPASFSESSGGDGHEAENGHAAGALSRQSSSSAGSTSSSVRSAKALAKWKRQIMAAGVVGTVITWALFVWFIFTYGMLIYKLLGDEAQSSFARSWGISYAMDAVTQWKARLRRPMFTRYSYRAVVAVADLQLLFLLARPARTGNRQGSCERGDHPGHPGVLLAHARPLVARGALVPPKRMCTLPPHAHVCAAP